MNFKPRPSSFDEKLSAIMGLVLGLLFIAGGFWVRQMDAREQATFKETQGVVVDSISRRDRNSSNKQEQLTYAPVIEFQTHGRTLRFTGRYESYRSSNGNQVVVRYDPQTPATTARVVEPLEGLTAWGMFGLGGIAVIFSLGTLFPLHKSSGGQQ